MKIVKRDDGTMSVGFENEDCGRFGWMTVYFESFAHVERAAKAMLEEVEKMKPKDPLESEEFTNLHGWLSVSDSADALRAWIRAHAAEIAEFERAKVGGARRRWKRKARHEPRTANQPP